MSIYSQEISFNNLNVSSENLKNSLLNSGNFFSNEPHELPYFQGKADNKYIKFSKSTGTIVIMDFKSQTEYLALINQIQSKASFRFKYCTNYDENVVYNYQTSNGNKLRFSFEKMRISVEYPSNTNKFLDSNFEITSVFVCISKDAYAYHTNLRCEGLGNCEAKIAKTNIKEAKNHDYKFCEICTSDDESKTLLSEAFKEYKAENNSYEYSETDYEYDDESYNNGDYDPGVLNPIVKKAEKMFANYLPKILESKGEGAFVDLQRTHVGDFTNDGIDDVIIWFNYSFGGNAIAGYECAFYETVGDHLRVVAGFEPNYIFSIKSIKNGIVYAEKIQYDKDDAHCCPSIKTPIELIYRDNKVYTLEK